MVLGLAEATDWSNAERLKRVSVCLWRSLPWDDLLRVDDVELHLGR